MATLIMRCLNGFYPIEASGKKPLAEEAADHGKRNAHILRVENLEGDILWQRIAASIATLTPEDVLK